MQTCINLADLSQDCLAKLNQALDLCLKTAEAASADNNHKVVLQAAREVTRIVSLNNKLTDPKAKPNLKSTPVPLAGFGGTASGGLPAFQKTTSPSPPGSDPPVARQPGKTGSRPDDLILPDLATFFPPHEVASWDGVTQDLFKDISRNYQELQALAMEAASIPPESIGGSGKSA
jgi:hypothetical protein